eukprot:jgi/Hompol1/5966/HPOL_000167-RA
MTKAKEQLETTAKATAQKHQIEISTRDARIRELGELRTGDANTIKKMQETKEQLVFQTTDLQNQLDRELSNVNVLTFEMAQVKRLSDEKAALLDEQIEKLTAAKSNLSNDKRQLTEKIKFVRTDLRQREEELEALTEKFREYRERAEQTELTLRRELDELSSAHTQQTRELKSLEGKHHMVVDMNVRFKMKQEQQQRALADLERRLGETTAELAAATATVTRQEAEAAELGAAHAQATAGLAAAEARVLELTEQLSATEAQLAASQSERAAECGRLGAALAVAQLDHERASDSLRRMRDTAAGLEAQLAAAQRALADETELREMLEAAQHDTRTQLQSERRLRMDFERMQTNIRARDAAREAELLVEWRLRNRKLADVAGALHGEHNRLVSFAALLPAPEMLGNIDLANTREFDWLLNDDAAVPPANGSKHHHHHHHSKHSQKSKRRTQRQSVAYSPQPQNGS